MFSDYCSHAESQPKYCSRQLCIPCHYWVAATAARHRGGRAPVRRWPWLHSRREEPDPATMLRTGFTMTISVHRDPEPLFFPDCVTSLARRGEMKPRSQVRSVHCTRRSYRLPELTKCLARRKLGVTKIFPFKVYPTDLHLVSLDRRHCRLAAPIVFTAPGSNHFCLRGAGSWRIRITITPNATSRTLSAMPEATQRNYSACQGSSQKHSNMSRPATLPWLPVQRTPTCAPTSGM